MQKIMLTLFVTSLLVGCSTLGVYKVDIPQGTPLTQAQASKIQVGMSHQQVRFLLGSQQYLIRSIRYAGTTSTTIPQEPMLKSQDPSSPRPASKNLL